MAKFCGKCGTRLDEKNGFCPKCDVIQHDRGERTDNRQFGQRVKNFFLKCLISLLITAILAVAAAGLLVYFELVDIPVISEIMQEFGIVKDKELEERLEQKSINIGDETRSGEETIAVTEDPADVAYFEAEDYCAVLEKQEEYILILQYLDDLKERKTGDTRYTDLRAHYEKCLRNKTVATAESYMQSGEYKVAANEIINIREIYTSSELEELLEKCKKHLSIPLSVCNNVEDSNSGGNMKDVGVGHWKDVFGWTHADSLRFWVVKKTGWQNTEFVVYELDQSYTTLSGEIVSANGSDAGSCAAVLIYLDGVLAYTSPEISPKTQPVQFEIDVSGVKQIRVACTTDADEFNYCIVDAMLCEI